MFYQLPRAKAFYRAIPLTPMNRPAVRYDGKKKLSGYLALWGNRNKVDCVGTWFDRDNPPDLGLGYDRRDYSTFLPFRLKYEHGADPDVKNDIIGMVTKVWEDDTGIAFEGELNTESKWYPRIAQELRDQKLATSTGSAEHLASFTKDNAFDLWNLAELSLTAFPCENRMPMVSLRSRRRKWARNFAGVEVTVLADYFQAYDDPDLERPIQYEAVPAGTVGTVIGTSPGNEYWVVEYPSQVDGLPEYFGFTEAEAEGTLQMRSQLAKLNTAAQRGVRRGLQRALDYNHLPQPFDVVEAKGSRQRYLLLAPQGYTSYKGVPVGNVQTIDLLADDFGIVGNLVAGLY